MSYCWKLKIQYWVYYFDLGLLAWCALIVLAGLMFHSREVFTLFKHSPRLVSQRIALWTLYYRSRRVLRFLRSKLSFRGWLTLVSF